MGNQDNDKRRRREVRAQKRLGASDRPQLEDGVRYCAYACKLSCAYKIRHADEAAAVRHINELKKKKGIQSPETLSTYFCQGCQSWYVGNKAESSQEK